MGGWDCRVELGVAGGTWERCIAPIPAHSRPSPALHCVRAGASGRGVIGDAREGVACAQHWELCALMQSRGDGEEKQGVLRALR